MIQVGELEDQLVASRSAAEKRMNAVVSELVRNNDGGKPE